MRAIVQRVSSASVTVAGEVVGSIGPGLLVLVGVADQEAIQAPELMARKISSLRIFADDAGKMNRSVVDVSGEVLVVSQFTLYADTSKGTRPSFLGSARSEEAEPVIRRFIDHLGALMKKVAEGRFGAHMEVHLTNDGPVTFVLEV